MLSKSEITLRARIYKTDEVELFLMGMGARACLPPPAPVGREAPSPCTRVPTPRSCIPSCRTWCVVAATFLVLERVR